MNFNSQRKNYTGMAVIGLAHVMAFVFALQHTKVWINHPDGPAAVEVLPLPPEPKYETPPPLPMPTQFTPPDVRPPTDWPVTVTITDTTPTIPEGVPVRRPVNPGPPAAGGGDIVVAKHEPLTVQPVIEMRACAKPAYPQSALRNGDTGTVTLAFLIGTDGHVAASKVEKSSGYRDLDRAAIGGLSQCRFKPGTVDGVPFESWTRVQYVWSLDD
ncbi:energy transducer TonB [Pseudoduganella sp. RAF53_2]|uniref:energy transducer TonB n=1 Tax=unclassified Pseudoduganella TaxID=2637179 RepID=UPI003F9EB7C6